MKKIFLAFVVLAAAGVIAVAQEKKDTILMKSDTVVIVKTSQTMSMSPEKGQVHLDFDIPFYHKIKNYGSSALVGAVGVGTIFSNSKAPLDFNPQNSLEFYFYTLDSKTHGHSTFSFGPGITFRNLGLTGGNAMSLAEDGRISVAPFQGGALKVSKLRVFSINAPLLYSYDFGGGFGFTLGPVVNLNTGSSIVNKYEQGGDKQKDKYKRVCPFRI